MVGRYGMPQMIKVDLIKHSPYQVRDSYNGIEFLARSIEHDGLLEPILVRPIAAGHYELVHGHRRLEAHRFLGRTYIQAFVKPMTDLEVIRVQGVENIQREDYNPIEEGLLYQQYMKRYRMDHGKDPSLQKIADEFKEPRENVRQRLMMLRMPEITKKHIIDGSLSVRKAMVLTRLTHERGFSGNPRKRDETGPHKKPTDEYMDQLEELTKYLAKNDQGEAVLETRKATQLAVTLIQEGKDVSEAVEVAKKDEVVRKAAQLAQKGVSPDDILKTILHSQLAQLDVDDVLRAKQEVLINNIVKMFTTGSLICPYCGGSCLEWGCKHKRLVS
jgi:ParB/RepB/Spo0J family partition protein